ncbi:sensor histidine kinase [Paenibacillus wulumuqiensis]|uniref:sensor histidine kinase n=1 Tax=Paenibacillus wulumuqiensis TaxID=1567107 RepID=UPI0006976CEF|nr:HAMP domain-containing sensor histidine kinase [Paenibacillus wulumuqiensis]
MKLWTVNRRSIYIAILICFIVGQLAGTLVIKHLFINYKLKDMYPQATMAAANIAEGRTDIIHSGQFILKAYTLSGQEITLGSETPQDMFHVASQQFREALTGYIPQVLGEGRLATTRDISGLPNHSIIVGVPIMHQGQPIGAVFLMEPSSEYQAVLNGFYVVFTVMLVVCTLCIGYFLSSYLKEMRRLDKARRDYVANISHELKSPIASIRALTETLADGLIHEEEKKNNYYSIILSECARLQRLIQDVLELSRMQNKQDTWVKEPLDSGEWMEFIESRYSFLAEELGIAFRISDQARSLPPLLSNRDKLIQLVNILIDNAMKFVGEDGLITLDAVVRSRSVTIRIADNGPGIIKEDLPYIFERFYKSDYSHQGNGSGLGLSIAHEIVQELGEDITVQSEPGQGTIFQFTIKRAQLP